MYVFCPVWGDKHLGLLKNALGRSLSWPSNRDAVFNSRWMVVTDGPASGEAAKKIIQEFCPSADIRIFEKPIIRMPGTDTGVVLMNVLFEVVQECIEQKMPMLMATPDFIYGNGTIDAFKRVASEPGTCAAIAHMRVLPSAIAEFWVNPLPSNAYLVSIGLNNSHQSWQMSENTASPSGCYRSGIRWERLSEKVLTVQHVMPSPFFVNFYPEDLPFFKTWHDNRPPGFGSWDHKWPKQLIAQGRLRLIGSSDAAVMIEITDQGANIPPINPENVGKAFFNIDSHNKVQKQFISVFRSS